MNTSLSTYSDNILNFTISLSSPIINKSITIKIKLMNPNITGSTNPIRVL